MHRREIGRCEPPVVERGCDKDAFISAPGERRDVGKSPDATAGKQFGIRHRVAHVRQHLVIQSPAHSDACQIQHNQRTRSSVDGLPRDGLDCVRESTRAAVCDWNASPQVETEHHAFGADRVADGLELFEGMQGLQANHDAGGVVGDRSPCRRPGANPRIDPERDARGRENRQLSLLRSSFEDGIEIGGVDRGHAKLLDICAREGGRIARDDCRPRDLGDWFIRLSPAAARAHRLPSPQIDDADYLHG